VVQHAGSPHRERETAPRLRFLKESNMLATGGLLVCIALLTLAVVAPVFRSSNPPEWTTRGWIGELVTLAIVCTLALGLGYLGAGAIAALQTGPAFIDLGLLAVVLLASVVIWRGLQARARAKAVEADASGYARVAESRQAQSGTQEATAEPLPVTTSEPAPPPKAA
jgi:choline-glycine betaine transporter